MINDSGDLGRGTSGVEAGINSQKSQIPEFTTWEGNSEIEGSGGGGGKSKVTSGGFGRLELPVIAGLSALMAPSSNNSGEVYGRSDSWRCSSKPDAPVVGDR